MPLGAMVLNRTLPAGLRQPSVAKAAGRLRDVAADAALVRELARISTSKPADVRSVLVEVADRFRDVTVVAGREAERRSELATAAPITAVVPTMPTDVHDLAGSAGHGRPSAGQRIAVMHSPAWHTQRSWPRLASSPGSTRPSTATRSITSSA